VIKSGFKSVREILCLGAHADDIEIGCGGTILKLLEENRDACVTWIVLSGSGDREDEAFRSAESFLSGASDRAISVEKFPDTLFPYCGKDIKEYFNELGRSISPDIILTHRLEDRHQDHRLVAELTWNTFRDNLILEYEIPKYEADLGTPNIYVHLDESICDRKVENITGSYASQADKPWFTDDTFRAMLRIRGIEAKSQSGFAEGLYCRKLAI
jgi:LmbE family N-acetylglucosaminyl deacetylase